jgi:hypothetical protein
VNRQSDPGPALGTPGRTLGAGALVLLAAGILAGVVRAVQLHAAGSPERSVAVGLAVMGLAAVLLASIGLIVNASFRQPATSARALLLAVTVAMSASYLVSVSAAMSYRADLLIWSESPFVSDVIKLQTGHPLYTDQANLESSIYTPGAPVLSWALGAALGISPSVPGLRAIQLGFAVIAALLGLLCVRSLLLCAGVEVSGWVWSSLSAAILFLCATNGRTNPFSHLLHNDALTLVVTTGAYLLSLEYARTRRPWLIGLMAIVPALGFMVKQSNAVWAPLFGLQLLVFDRPWEWRRVAGFGVVAGLVLAGVLGLGRVWWGPPFPDWVIATLSHHPTSMLRSFQHALDAWVFFAAGLAGGLFLLPARAPGRLLGPWVVWLSLLSIEAYTSGIAWMLNHLGPGSLLAGVWFCGLLAWAWPRERIDGLAGRWLEAGVAAALGIVAVQGMAGGFRLPLSPITADHRRYAAAIEAEFRDLPADRVLLDAGSWVYLAPGVVMRDRSTPVGDLGYAGIGDFRGILSRIHEHYYARILVHDFKARDLAYDHFLWAKSSGIRAALEESYQVVREIPGVSGPASPWLRGISVLEPKPPSAP